MSFSIYLLCFLTFAIGPQALANLPGFPTDAGVTIDTTSTTNPHLYPHGASVSPVVSADGNYVVFSTTAGDLATPLGTSDTNTVSDVYLWRKATNDFILVSHTPGTQTAGNDNSVYPTISADGRWIAFSSDASDLVANGGDTNGVSDVFLFDSNFPANDLIRISVNNALVEGDGKSSSVSISNDGKKILFKSTATNFVSGDNHLPDIFLRDLSLPTPTTRRINQNSAGVVIDGTGEARISGNGRFVVFESPDSPLVPEGNGNGGELDIVRVDITQPNPTFELISHPTGSPNSGNSSSKLPSISDDGNHIAFISDASDLVSNDNNNFTDPFAYDATTGETTRLDLYGGDPGTSVNNLQISHNGRWVIFETKGIGWELPPGAVQQLSWTPTILFAYDLFPSPVKFDQLTNLTAADAQVDGRGSVITDTGDYIVYAATGTVIPGVDLNFLQDIFALYTPDSFPVTCAGDGSGAQCPCGNGAQGRGCSNSVSPDGALLYGQGYTSITSDSVSLITTDLPSHGFAVMYQSNSLLGPGGAGITFGAGVRCGTGGIIKTSVRPEDPSGTLVWGYFDNTGNPFSIAQWGQVPFPMSGTTTRIYQVWYRNPTYGCFNGTHNMTNSVQINWRP